MDTHYVGNADNFERWASTAATNSACEEVEKRHTWLLTGNHQDKHRGAYQDTYPGDHSDACRWYQYRDEAYKLWQQDKHRRSDLPQWQSYERNRISQQAHRQLWWQTLHQAATSHVFFKFCTDLRLRFMLSARSVIGIAFYESNWLALYKLFHTPYSIWGSHPVIAVAIPVHSLPRKRQATYCSSFEAD